MDKVDLREYLEWAMEGRRRVKEQLKKLAAHDFSKTAFTYIEIDTGREYSVEVPEQPDVDPVAKALEEPNTSQATHSASTETAVSSTEDLIAAGKTASLSSSRLLA